MQDLCAFLPENDQRGKVTDVIAALGKFWADRRGVWHGFCVRDLTTKLTKDAKEEEEENRHDLPDFQDSY